MSTYDNKFNEQLVDRIVSEVLYQIDKGETEENISSGTAVLITSYVPSFRSAVTVVEKTYPEEICYLGIEGYTIPEGIHTKVKNAEDMGYPAVLDLIAKKKNIVLLAPTISLLEDIVSRRDNVFAAFIMIRSLLWNKNVSLLLDFEQPRFRNNTILGRVNEILGELKSIGIDVKEYDLQDIYEDGILQLVTERDVRDAYLKEKKSIKKAPGAIVTPAAKDAASELKINID